MRSMGLQVIVLKYRGSCVTYGPSNILLEFHYQLEEAENVEPGHKESG